MNSLKIALAGNSAWSILNFREDLIKNLIASGHQVVVLAPFDQGKDKLEELGCIFEDVVISRRGLNPFTDFLLVLKYSKLIKRHSFDFILTFNPKPNIYNCFATFFSRTKIVVNISGLGSGFIKNNILRKLLVKMYYVALKKAHKIFFQNSSDQKVFEDLGILKKNTSSLLPGSGINLHLFSKNNHHLSNLNKVQFTFVGRLLKDKGLLEFIEAAKFCIKQKPNLIFNIYGDLDDGNPSSVTKDFIKHAKTRNIFFKGHINDIRAALSETHCIVLPSYREGLSRSLLEAAALGIPIIATNVPGCRELVDQNINGFLCKVRDPNDLGKKILKFANLDAESIITMGNNSRIKAETDYSVDIVIKKYLDVLKN